MKDISIYFEPIANDFTTSGIANIGSKMEKNTNHFPELEPGMIAVLSVPEYRNMDVSLSVPQVANVIRQELYQLYPKRLWSKKMVDLGTLLPGHQVQDTFYALTQVVEELVKNDILPIIVGGSQDLTLAQFDAYKNLEQLVNLVSIDSMPDFGHESELQPNNYLQHILKRKPNHLFNCSIIGTQSYLISQDEMDLMESLYFDLMRLGDVHNDIAASEPLLRNADIVSFDLLSLRNADFPREIFTNPNGLYAEQICQLARYTGMSDKVSSIGIYNMPALEDHPAIPQLVAQIIWHLIDGINNRFNDFPKTAKSEYIKYSVVLSDFKDEVVFYKSPKSDRWWIEIPYHSTQGAKYERHVLVPCSYSDYQIALENEVPNLWWQTYQKIFV